MADQEIEVEISASIIALHEKYKFFQDSYDGGMAYKDGKYLFKHKRESETDYKSRLDRASYMNFCQAVVDVYNSYLYREEPTRELKSPSAIVDSFLENADLEGRSWQKVMRELSKLAGALGVMGVIVDKPKGEAISRAEEIQDGIRPYVAIYHPTAILGWEFERIGGFPTLTKLILKEGEIDELDQIIVWTRDEWARYERKEKIGVSQDKYELVEAVDNELGVIPFALLRNKDGFKRMSGISDIADIADVNKRIYRFDSNADEIIENCAFPMLEGSGQALKSTAGKGNVNIGSQSVLDRGDDEESGGFKYVEPEHTSLDAILMWRQEAINDIRYLAKINAGESKEGGQVESAEALELRFQQLNALLSDKAENSESFEGKVFGFVALWEVETIDMKVEYPRKFGIKDLMHDLDIALSSQGLIGSRTFTATMNKEIAVRLLPNDTEKEVLTEIEKEIDAGPVVIGDEESTDG